MWYNRDDMDQNIFYKILLWAPRVLAIVFIIFLSLFALDVFDMGYSGWELFIALFMHLLPSIGLIIALIVAWKRELLGGILFLGLGIYMAYKFFGFAPRSFPVVAILLAPVFVVGIMFVINHFLQIKQKTKI